MLEERWVNEKKSIYLNHGALKVKLYLLLKTKEKKMKPLKFLFLFLFAISMTNCGPQEMNVKKEKDVSSGLAILSDNAKEEVNGNEDTIHHQSDIDADVDTDSESSMYLYIRLPFITIRPPKNGYPYQVGVSRKMPKKYRGDLTPHLNWVKIKNHLYASRTVVISPKAKHMRMGVIVDLSSVSHVCFFGESQPIVPMVNSNSNSNSNKSLYQCLDYRDMHKGTIWSPIVNGDRIGVEVFVYANKKTKKIPNSSFKIDRISHGYR